LWENSLIKIGNKPVFWKEWFRAGITWIQDIIKVTRDGNLEIMTKDELDMVFQTRLKTLEYNGLVRAIPATWRRTIHSSQLEDEEEIDDPKLINCILDSKNPGKWIYNELIKGKGQQPTGAMHKWNRDLQTDIDHNDILRAHKKNHFSSISNKLRSYNCNFLNRNVPYNKKLLYMKKKDSADCEHCGTEENLIHLYWECPITSGIWQHLGQLMKEVTKEELDIDATTCLLGHSEIELPKRTRHLFLLTKQYIHINKCNGDKEPNHIGLESFIKSQVKIEQENSRIRGTLQEFNQKWAEWTTWALGREIAIND
jgi:hypothetical protein